MSEETAKLLIEAMNRLAEALAKSGNQTIYHYHYQSPPPQPYFTPYPYYTNPPVWVGTTNGAVYSQTSGALS